MADLNSSTDPLEQERIVRERQLGIDRMVMQKKENEFKLFNLKLEIKRFEQSIIDIDKAIAEKSKEVEDLKKSFAKVAQ